MKIIQCKNELFDKLGSLFEYNYKDGKREVSSLKILKILDNTDHLTKNTSVKLVEYFGNLIIVAVLMLLVYIIDINILSRFGFIFNLLRLFLMTFLVFSGYNYLVLFISYLFKGVYHSYLKKSLKMRRVLAFLSFVKYFWIKLLVLMPMNAFIIGTLTIYMFQTNNNLFMEYDLNKEFDGAVWSFWLIFFLVSVASCISFNIVLQSQNIFELEDMGDENRLILGILAIVTFIIGVDIDKVRPIGIVLLVLVIQTAFFEFRQSQLLSKMYEKAQAIFQEQLLLDAPDYKKLKKCYFYGGEKYKEKLLSTEKFSEVVVKNELKSLKDLKNYDDYMLYKAYKGRSYL
ncbi:beta-carotene 15,15'-monooxygenase [Streptococcus cristatus]|jgi:hypothetical protein|uniref:beta-carotene 15,15'-monooxygenase n=1 Tax=Streptococcus cristatus TaxID=45634 RepID=UPI001652EDEC|nr:beta-carotene 15,15'-monooxygenase [Streptococcus cristatus]